MTTIDYYHHQSHQKTQKSLNFQKSIFFTIQNFSHFQKYQKFQLKNGDDVFRFIEAINRYLFFF